MKKVLLFFVVGLLIIQSRSLDAFQGKFKFGCFNGSVDIVPTEAIRDLGADIGDRLRPVLVKAVTQATDSAADKLLESVGKLAKEVDGSLSKLSGTLKDSGALIKDTAKEATVSLVTGAKDLNGSINKWGDSIRKQVEDNTKTFDDSLKKIKASFEKLGQAAIPIRNQAILATAGIATVIGAGVLMTVAGRKFIRKYLYTPQLVEERSGGFWSRIRRPKKPEAIWGKPKKDKLEDHMVIDDRLAKEIHYIIKMTANIKKNGGYFENVLFHGVPGTGKTLTGKLIAQYCGMDYMFVPAANVSQFLANGRAVEELNDLFESAARSKRGTIIILDEGETFLANRTNLNAAAQNALGAFLAKTGTPSNKIMIIVTTNRPGILDSAVMSRLGMTVKFPLPDEKARYDQIALHVKKIFGKQTGTKVKYDYLSNPDNVKKLAARLNGASGRIIQKVINRLRQLALAQNILCVNQDIIDQVLGQIKTDQQLIDQQAAAAAA